MPWYVYALLASLLFAIIPLQKRKYNHNQRDVMFWSSVFAFLFTLILFPILEFPKNDWFYLGAIFTGLTGVFGGFLQFKLSDHNKGRVLPVQMPLQILACFAFYCFLQPSYFQDLIASPYKSAIMAVALFGLFISTIFLRKNLDAGIKSIITILPISILFAAIVIYYKLLMNLMVPEQVSNIILAYIMVHYFTVSICLLVENIFNKQRVINITDRLTSNSLMIAILYVFAYYFMFTAVYYATNPALAIAFNILVPVWIKIYSVIIKRNDDANLNIALAILMLFGVIVSLNA